MKSLVETVRNMYRAQPLSEATMMKDNGEVVHNCARHVEHAEWGRGQCLSEQHATPDAAGNIAWYDVMFEHGIERAVPTASLNILASEAHMHGGKKKQPAMEAADLSQDVEDDEDEEDKPRGKKKSKEDADMCEDTDLDLEFTEDELDAIAEAYMGFEKTTRALAARGAKNPQALAAWIGRKKYGKEKFQRAAAAGRKLGEEVDETIEYRARTVTIDEAQVNNYDAHFRAMMKKHGIKHPGELDTPEKKKAFFNAVDASYKAKNEDVFLEEFMRSDVQKNIDGHIRAGNKVTDVVHTTKNGHSYHSFVVTEPSGKRSRRIYHGNSQRLETMSPAPKSKLAADTGEDDNDK